MIQELRYVGWEPGRYEFGGDGAELVEIAGRATRAIEEVEEELRCGRLGRSRSTVWRCASSGHVTTATVERLCREIGMSGDWLMLGIGPASLPPPAAEATTRAASSRLSALVRELGQRSSEKQEPATERWAQALA